MYIGRSGLLADNGNFLEPDDIAVRHGVCGDPGEVRHIQNVSRTHTLDGQRS